MDGDKLYLLRLEKWVWRVLFNVYFIRRIFDYQFLHVHDNDEWVIYMHIIEQRQNRTCPNRTKTAFKNDLNGNIFIL